MDADFPSSILIGLNHDTASLELREKLSFDPSSVSQKNRNLRDALTLEETVIVSTCNRTEIYCVNGDAAEILQWLARDRDVSEVDLKRHTYTRKGVDVLAHASKVASGMESMVVGETQIFGQMKEAFRKADSVGCVGPELRDIFSAAFSIAKNVRTNTDIGKHSISLASVAMKLIDRIDPTYSNQSILFVGAGEMIQLFATYFLEKNFSSISFVNRTVANAKALADEYGGDYYGLDSISEIIDRFDVIVSCTASPVPVIGHGLIDRTVLRRKHRPLVIFDLAVPRDIESSVSKIDDVFLYSIDDLGELTSLGEQLREAALFDAGALVADGVFEYVNKRISRKHVGVIKSLRDFGGKVVDEELEKALLALQKQSPPEETLRILANSIKNKLLDRPCRAVNSADNQAQQNLAYSLSKLFNLDS